MPTRFARMLAQIVRGGLVLGMEREHLTKLATRIAIDSVPPLRLDILGGRALPRRFRLPGSTARSVCMVCRGAGD